MFCPTVRRKTHTHTHTHTHTRARARKGKGKKQKKWRERERLSIVYFFVYFYYFVLTIFLVLSTCFAGSTRWCKLQNCHKSRLDTPRNAYVYLFWSSIVQVEKLTILTKHSRQSKLKLRVSFTTQSTILTELPERGRTKCPTFPHPRHTRLKCYNSVLIFADERYPKLTPLHRQKSVRDSGRFHLAAKTWTPSYRD